MSENKPLTQSLKLKDNFTSVLDKIEKKLKSTTGVLNDFAKLGSTPIALSMTVKDEAFKASVDGVKREFDGLTEMAKKGIQLDMYKGQLAERTAEIKNYKTQYNKALDDMVQKTAGHQKALDLSSEKLALLSQKAELLKNKMGSTSDEGKLNQMSLQLNGVNSQINNTVETIRKQKQALNESEQAMRFLAQRSKDVESAYTKATMAAQAMASIPTKAAEKENRHIVRVQTLKDKYNELVEAQRRATMAASTTNFLGSTTNEFYKLSQASNSAFLNIRTKVAQTRLKVAEFNTTVSQSASKWYNQLKPIQAVRNAIDKIQVSYLGLTKGQVGWRGALTATKSVITSLGDKITQNIGKQRQMTNEIKRSGDAQKTLNYMAGLMTFKAALNGLQSLKRGLDGIMEQVDSITNIQTKIKMISDDPQKTNNQIMGSAVDSRSDYATTADFVTKTAINSPDAFNNTEEIIKFSNTLQKMYKLGGATTAEQESSMMQLQQSLAQGYMQGQELNSVMKGAPLLIQAIADEMGVTKGELKELGKEGEISADVIRRAMFSSSDDIDKKFAEMPMKWEDHMTKIKNFTTFAFSEIQQKIASFLNSDMGKSIISGIMSAIQVIATVINVVGRVIGKIINFIVENLEAVKIALVILGTIAAVVGAIMFISFVIANLPIILLVAIIALVAFALQEMGVTAGDVVRFIISVIFALWAVLYNIFIFIVNICGYTGAIFIDLGQSIILAFKYVWAAVKFIFQWMLYLGGKVALGIGIHFFDFASSALSAFGAISDGFGSLMNWMAEKLEGFLNWALKPINKILGALGKDTLELELGRMETGDSWASKLSDKTKGYADDLRAKSDKMKKPEFEKPEMFESAIKDWNEYSKKNLKYKDVGEYYDKGGEWYDKKAEEFSDNQDKIADKWKDLQDKFKEGIGDKSFQGTPSPGNGYIPPEKSAAEKIGKGKDLGNVDADAKIKDEDLKYLRDIAERQFTMNYQQLTPQATVNYYGAGGSDEDVDRLLGRMEAMIAEKTESSLV